MFVTLSLTVNETLKMALIAAHLNAGVISGGDSERYILSPPLLPPLLSVPNKRYGFCGR